MSHDHSQLGRVPSESSHKTCHTDTNIDQLLTMGAVTIHESLLEVATTTTIVVHTNQQAPNDTVQNTLTTRQLARQRQHQRRRQRQRDRQLEMNHQQRQRQGQNWILRSPPHSRPHRNYTTAQWIPRRLEDIFWNPLHDRDPRQEPMECSSDEALLDAYELERIDPRDTLDQEQLYEFEGFVFLEHLQLLSDEIEQQQNVDAEERFEQAKEEERSAQQLLQLEQCDQIDFLLLQMNQPLVYDD